MAPAAKSGIASPRVGQVVVALEEPQRGGGDLAAEPGEVALAGHTPHPDRRGPDPEGLARLQLAHDERDQVGGHPDGIGELDDLLAALEPLGHHACVRHRGQVRVDDERAREDGLEVRLVPAGEGAPGVGGLELGGGQRAGGAGGGVLERRAVEATELVV
jgi:hypothetical protein